MQTNLILENLMAMVVYYWVLSRFFESKNITQESPLLTDIYRFFVTDIVHFDLIFV